MVADNAIPVGPLLSARGPDILWLNVCAGLGLALYFSLLISPLVGVLLVIHF